MRRRGILTATLTALLMLAALAATPALAEVSDSNGDLQVTLYKTGGGLGEYPFDPRPWEPGGTTGFTQCGTTTIDRIAYDWGEDLPFWYGGGCGYDHLIAHIVGTLSVPDSGRYVFRKSSDDGFTVLINGELIIEEWDFHGFDSVDSESVTLREGRVYRFEAWWMDGEYGAGAFLSYSRNGRSFESIPATWFGAGGDGDPQIEAVSRRELIGSTIDFADDRIRWAWMRCTEDGDSGIETQLPRDCRVTANGSGKGSTLSRRPYQISRSDLRAGFIRLAIYSRGEWHFSAAHSLVLRDR